MSAAAPVEQKSGLLARKEPEAVDVALTDVKPRLVNAREVQMALQRLYPARLREERVTGRTVLRFVIDVDGQVDPESITVVSTSRREFTEVSTAVVLAMRFTPARYRGRPIPAMITIPIDWTLMQESIDPRSRPPGGAFPRPSSPRRVP